MMEDTEIAPPPFFFFVVDGGDCGTARTRFVSDAPELTNLPGKSFAQPSSLQIRTLGSDIAPACVNNALT